MKVRELLALYPDDGECEVYVPNEGWECGIIANQVLELYGHRTVSKIRVCLDDWSEEYAVLEIELEDE